MDFITPSRKVRLAQLGYLFKHTFAIFGRHLSITRPIVRMSVYAIVMLCVFAAGLVLIALERAGGGWLLFLGVLLYLYKFFYYNKVSLVLSRMVYVSATGGDPTAQSARAHLKGLRRQVFVLGLLDMLIAWVRSKKDKDGSGFFNLLISGVASLGDLVTSFLLPVFAVDRHGLRDSLGTLRALKDNVPESLSGVFGLAILKRVVSSVLGLPWLLGIAAGIGAGLLWGGSLPPAFALGELGEAFPIPDDFPIIGPHTVFSWLPLFIVVFLGLAANAILARIVDALHTVYYTLFYTRVNHAHELTPDLRRELDGFLKLEDRSTPDTPASPAGVQD